MYSASCPVPFCGWLQETVAGILHLCWISVFSTTALSAPSITSVKRTLGLRESVAQDCDGGKVVAPQDFLNGMLRTTLTAGTRPNRTVDYHGRALPPSGPGALPAALIIHQAVHRGSTLATTAAHIHVRRPAMLRTETRHAVGSVPIARLALAADRRYSYERNSLVRHELAELVTAVNVARPAVG